MAEVCAHKLDFKDIESSPYWVRLILACKKCKEEVVTLVDRKHFDSGPADDRDAETVKQLQVAVLESI